MRSLGSMSFWSCGICRVVNSKIESTHTFCNVDDRNEGLFQACRVGQKDIAILMINKGSNNFTVGLLLATSHMHKDLIELVIVHDAYDLKGCLELSLDIIIRQTFSADMLINEEM